MSSTTDTAKEQAGHLAGTAKDEAANVAGEAKAQARNVMQDARTMVDEQSRTGRDRLVETTRTLGSDLEQMADNGPDGMAGDIARQVAQKARDLGDMLDGREPSDILDDVRSFARRRPGTFLLGALVAGVAVGRFARGAKDAQSATSPNPSYGTPVRGPSGQGSLASQDLGAEAGYGASATGTYAGTTGTGAYAGTTGAVDTGYAATGTGVGSPEGTADTQALENLPETRPHGDPLGDEAERTTVFDTPIGDESERRTL